jgi:hypothetical protein
MDPTTVDVVMGWNKQDASHRLVKPKRNPSTIQSALSSTVAPLLNNLRKSNDDRRNDQCSSADRLMRIYRSTNLRKVHLAAPNRASQATGTGKEDDICDVFRSRALRAGTSWPQRPLGSYSVRRRNAPLLRRRHAILESLRVSLLHRALVHVESPQSIGVFSFVKLAVLRSEAGTDSGTGSVLGCNGSGSGFEKFAACLVKQNSTRTWYHAGATVLRTSEQHWGVSNVEALPPSNVHEPRGPDGSHFGFALVMRAACQWQRDA